MTSNRVYQYFIVFQLIILSFVFYRTSSTLSLFIDEYISLTASTEFFKGLNFNAGYKAGGNFSVVLTSGPLSAVGSVIGWALTKNIVISRFTNFLWALIINFVLIKVIKRYFEFNEYTFLSFSSFSLILIPWNFGILYSIGEVVSTLIFFYGVLLLPKNRKLSLTLLSLSIFYGKFILIILFAVFYSFYFLKEKNFKDLMKNLLYFSFPLIAWLLLVSIKYQGGGILNYIHDFINFNFTMNQSAGINELSRFSIKNLFFSYQNSEVINWNIADLLRVLISPIIFVGLSGLVKNKCDLPLKNIITPLQISTFSLYLWFWLLSPTKWIRYSQHFLLIQILFLLFIIAKDNQILDSKFLLFGFGIYFSLFLNSILIISIYVLTLLILVMFRFKLVQQNFYILLIVFFQLNTFNAYYELGSKTIFKFDLENCIEELINIECYKEFDG